MSVEVYVIRMRRTPEGGARNRAEQRNLHLVVDLPAAARCIFSAALLNLGCRCFESPMSQKCEIPQEQDEDERDDDA